MPLPHVAHCNPDDGSSIFLQNVSIHLQDCIMSKSRRPQSEKLYYFMKSTIFWNIIPCNLVGWKSTNNLEEHVASIFQVEQVGWKARPVPWRGKTHGQKPTVLYSLCELYKIQFQYNVIHVWINSSLALLATCLHVGFLLGLFFNPEDGGDMFLRNIDFQHTTQHYIPEDRPLHNNLCENSKSFILFYTFNIYQTSFTMLVHCSKKNFHMIVSRYVYKLIT
jgi:hypothetical protein